MADRPEYIPWAVSGSGTPSPAAESRTQVPSSLSQSAAAPRPRGTIIGRYVVLSPIARGGMGEVMLAHDTLLERQVALKVMLTSVASDVARQRMVREAQAMARVSHPNVVGIFDVGLDGGNVFLAMEYVEGVTLREWLGVVRTPREVLAVLKQAGRGLAAAHRANVIHRDFKPANVVVTASGHAYVLDFGIARGITDAASPPIADAEPLPAGIPPPAETLLERTLTHLGHRLGTAGYVAPEALLGGNVDARADVFSFSVTAWRALCGSMPFPHQTFEEYTAALRRRDPVRPPKRKVPQWLRAVLLRGLALDPGARFASMDEMLAALDADPWRRRAAFAATAGVAALVTVGAVGKARHDTALRARCAAEGEAIGASWNGPAREAAERAMLAEADPGARDRTAQTLVRLDEYVRSWKSEQIASCEATRIRATQPAAAHEKRSQCLLDARIELEFLAAQLATSDAVSHRRSLLGAGELPLPRNCTATSVDGASALPADPAARAAAVEGRRDLLRAEVLLWSGAWQESQRLAQQSVERGREAGDGALEARGELLVASGLLDRNLHQEAMPHLRTAMARAEASGADHLSGVAAAKAAGALLQGLEVSGECAGWLEFARGKLARLGRDDALEASILGMDVIAQLKKDPQLALETSARAIDLQRRFAGELQRGYCLALNSRGIAYEMLHDEIAAEPWFKQAVDCQLRAAGVDNTLVYYYGNTADTQLSQGRWDDAVESLRRGLEARRGLGENDRLVSTMLGMEAYALARAGRFVEAEATARQAIAMEVGDASTHATAFHALGLARAGLGDPGGAREACARGFEVSGVRLDPAVEYDNDILVCVGEAELALGEIAAARRDLERDAAIPLRGDAGDLAIVRFALARALIAGAPGGPSAPDVPRARSLARQAKDELASIVARFPYRSGALADVERWLAEHPEP